MRAVQANCLFLRAYQIMAPAGFTAAYIIEELCIDAPFHAEAILLSRP